MLLDIVIEHYITNFPRDDEAHLNSMNTHH